MHPDLAGALAEAGQLTSESTKEQSYANLNLMTTEEKLKMAHLNKQYKGSVDLLSHFMKVKCESKSMLPKKNLDFHL